MPILQDFRSLADSIRGLLLPETQGGLDVVQSQLTINTILWNGGRPGSDGGFSTVASTQLKQQYPVMPLTTREVAESGGRYEMGMIKFGPVTPAYTDSLGVSGGYTESQLLPSSPDDAHEIVYSIVGQHQGDYQAIELQSNRPYSFFLVLKRRLTSPSVT
jgi:hypothetical protein